MYFGVSDQTTFCQIVDFAQIVEFNSPGANGVLNAIFLFWAKMKTVFTASCDDLYTNFLT